jgi:hypothetical protein
MGAPIVSWMKPGLAAVSSPKKNEAGLAALAREMGYG